MAKKCVKCGHMGLETMIPTLYHYKMSGLDNVYLKGGVTESICPKCGNKSTTIKNMSGLHKVMANSIAIAKRRLAGNELRFLREQLGFSAEDLAGVVEYSEDHIRKIETGVNIPKASYEAFLRVAILYDLKAPEYDLRNLVERKEYKLEELKFVNKDQEWQLAAA